MNRLIGTFAHYPIGYELFQNVFNKLGEMNYSVVQLNLDPMTVQKDLEEKYSNLYGSFKNIIGDALKEEPTFVDDFTTNLVTLDLDLDSFMNFEEQ
jgi:type IV secretory pathway VirB6-like protein